MSSFSDRLAELGFRSYAAYLRSEIWTEFKRAYKRTKRPNACQVCGHKKVQLHHTTYARLGCEKLTDVVPLCDIHHTAVHAWLDAHHLPVEATKRAVAGLIRLEATPKPPKADKPVATRGSVGGGNRAKKGPRLSVKDKKRWYAKPKPVMRASLGPRVMRVWKCEACGHDRSLSVAETSGPGVVRCNWCGSARMSLQGSAPPTRG